MVDSLETISMAGGSWASNTGGKVTMDSASNRNIDEDLKANSISGTANDLRNRLQDIYFANTTELNSTISVVQRLILTIQVT